MYKNLINLIIELIKQNSIIKEAKFTQLQEYIEHNKTFPYCVIEPGLITYNKEEILYSVRMYLLDQRLKDRSNELTIMSEMNEVARKFLRVFNLYGIHKNFQVNYDALGADVEFYTQDEETCGIILSFGVRVFVDNQGQCDPYTVTDSGNL